MTANQAIPASNRGLSDFAELRNAFWWMFLASLLTLFVILIPIAALVGFIGFLFMIIGFGKAAKSGTKHAAKYKLVHLILIAAFVIWLLSIIASLTLSFASLIPLIVASLIGYIAIIIGLRNLSEDFGQPKFKKAGNYLIAALATWLLALVVAIVVVIAIYSTLTNVGSLLILIIDLAFNPNGTIASYLVELAAPFILMYLGMIFTTIAYSKANKTLKALVDQPFNVAMKSEGALAPAHAEGTEGGVGRLEGGSSALPNSGIFCTQCGSNNSSSSRFCFKCGNRITQGIEQ